ncbi:MAG: nodulation protein NfeD [Pseudomonadota bacterium]
MCALFKNTRIVFICFIIGFFIFVSRAAAKNIDAVRIDDPITPVIAEFIIQCIEEAEEQKAECLIIEMDTPGGLDLAMRDIIKKILSSSVPVVVYIAPGGARAASAGAIIAIASHVAAMAPGTNIGAAHPVNMGGENMGKEMAAKVENDSAAYAETLAVTRKRNKDWAIKAVRESVSISAEEALKIHVIDCIASDMQKLIAALDGREVETAQGKLKLQTKGLAVVQKKMGIRENVLQSLADPNIAYILLLIGLAGLYFELSTPGAILPGVIGGISLILAFYSLQTLSANYAGVLFILLGTILFIAEIKIASYGLLSIGGIVALTLGSLMLFNSTAPYLTLSWTVIIPSVACIWLFFVVLIGLVIKAQKKKPVTGLEGLIGLIGEVRVDIDKKGKVFVHGEYWDAQSETPVRKGQRVRVKSAEGMLLTVDKIDS